MKKKIIGIILTLTMVLTMLPVLALPTKADAARIEQDLKVLDAKGNPATEAVSEDVVEGDYYWDGNTLIILKSDLVIKGTLYDGNIVLKEDVKSVTLDGVKILPDNNQIEFGIQALGDAVEIKLINDNQIGDKIIENGSLDDEDEVVLCGIDSQDLTFKGDGNLKIYGQITGIGAYNIYDVTYRNITFDKTFGGTITIEHMANDRGLPGAIATRGEVILSGGTIKITSYRNIGIFAKNIRVDNTIKQAEIYGSYETENVKIGALVSYGNGEKPIAFSNDLLVLGEENAEPTFKTEDIKGTVELEKIEIDEEPFYVYKVKDAGVAKALVIKQPSTPTNPETEDTRAMLIWAFAGLFALAVAAGILVSRKQRD